MTQRIRTYSAALALLFVSSPTWAQTNAESIRTRVKDGQKVSITDDRGQEFRRQNRHPRDVTGSECSWMERASMWRTDRIVRIDHPPDSLANGALIGFGVGAALGLTAMASHERLRSDGISAVPSRMRAATWRARCYSAAWAPLLESGSMPSSTATARSTGAVPARTPR